jgi:translation initiation factor 2B subunit (eIF-2B alpha/beta/delta family)
MFRVTEALIIPALPEERSDVDRLHELRTAIADNTVPGGSAFGRAAAEVILLTLSTRAADASGVSEELATTADWLVATKPSMTSVRTVAQLAHAAMESGGPTAVIDAMHGFIAESEAAIASIARHADAIIPAGSTVLFHSYSGSLIEVLGHAAEHTPDLTYLFTESRPYRESRRVVAHLRRHPVTFVGYSDAAVVIAAQRADLAIVGADALFADGSFANKTGTMPLALACRHVGIPLYVATEVSKLYPGDPADVQMELRPPEELHEGWDLAVTGRAEVVNQFFETVPADYVTAYLTDQGILEPGALGAVTTAR